MTEIVESGRIAGVKIAKLRAHGDERGRFLETFRKFASAPTDLKLCPNNRSMMRRESFATSHGALFDAK